MTRIFEIEKDEFERIEKGYQKFIILKNDKQGIRAEDVIILQDIDEDTDGPVLEQTFIVDFFLIEGVKTGYVLLALRDKTI